MPEMLEAFKEQRSNQLIKGESVGKVDQDHANSIMSGILNVGYGIGLTLGPLNGATLYEYVGFRMTLNITGVLVAIELVAYLACAKGCQAYS